jgi:hypothetical protein
VVYRSERTSDRNLPFTAPKRTVRSPPSPDVRCGYLAGILPAGRRSRWRDLADATEGISAAPMSESGGMRNGGFRERGRK